MIWNESFTITVRPVNKPFIFMTEYYLDDTAVGNGDGLANTNESVKLFITLENKGMAANNVLTVLSTTNTNINISDSIEFFGNMPNMSSKKCTDDFVFFVKPSAVVNEEVFFSLVISDSSSNKWTNEFFIKVLPPYVPSGASCLLVDNDQSGDGKTECLGYYTNALLAVGTNFDTWNVDDLGRVSPSIITQYKVVIWFTGDNNSDTFTLWDRKTIAHFLTNGGRLFATGMDFGRDLHRNGDLTGPSFYTNYFNAKYVNDDADLLKLRGITNDIISSGITLMIVGGTGAGNQFYPSEIDPISDAAPVFIYDKTYSANIINKGSGPKRREISPSFISGSGTGGIKTDKGIYALVYLAFGFEGIDNFSDRSNLMGNIMEWLYLPLLKKRPIITEIKTLSSDTISLKWEKYYTNITCFSLFRGIYKDHTKAKSIIQLSNNITSYTDTGLAPGTIYFYWVRAFNTGRKSPFSDVAYTPTGYRLPAVYGVFPTYFNPDKHGTARIHFSGLRASDIEIIIYDVAGNRVRTWEKEEVAGKQDIPWDGKDDQGRDLNAGIYIVYLKGIDKRIKMILIK